MLSQTADTMLHLKAIDYFFLFFYVVVILAIGLMASRATKTSSDYFISGRSMPAWISGIAFVSANMGALELIGNAANGAQYGASAVHFFWLGAIPAMVFLGVVMMPFYYSTRVHSVPEYLRRRYDKPTHVLNAVIFACSQVLLSGVNLYALALIIQLLLGWPLWLSIVLGAVIVLLYIFLGGLSAAIYGEVLQFFVIFAGLLPIVILGLYKVGGFSGLVQGMPSHSYLMTWEGSSIGHWMNPMGDWFGMVAGLGFLLSFGYWTTNFAEVQRALSSKNLNAARRSPIIGAFPKLFLPLITVIPGMLALVLIPNIGKAGGPDFNSAIPGLMAMLLPNGVLGLAVTALIAGFMAGMAANVSGFNTVFTYDLWRPYLKPNRGDDYYLKIGRYATVFGILVSIGTAFIAAMYSNLQNYMQSLFSFFNVPLFGIFFVGLFWHRTSPWGSFWGMLIGTVCAAIAHVALPHFSYFYLNGVVAPENYSAQMVNFYSAIVAFIGTLIALVLVTLVTPPKPVSELKGLVWGIKDPDSPDAAEAAIQEPAYRSPAVLGVVIIGLTVIASIIWILYVRS